MSVIPIGTISDVVYLPPTPPVDYTSRDYQSLVTDLINLIPNYLPEWTDRSPGDFGIVLIELFAYMGDILNYYSDRVANEAYLPTARQRQSVLNIADLLDYTPHNNVAATVNLQFTIISPSSSPIQIPAGFQVSTSLVGTNSIIFETDQVLTIWGDLGTANTTVNNFTGTGTANQKYLLSGTYQGTYGNVFPYDGAHQTVTVNGVAWARAPGNSFTGQTATAQMYVIVNTYDPKTNILTSSSIQFGGGTTGSPGALPGNGQPIVVTFYAFDPATGGQYQAQVSSTQGYTVKGETLGSSTGAVSQRFPLFRTPVVDGSQTIWVQETAAPLAWKYFQRLVDAYSTDLAYTLSTDANGIVTVIFGDGTNGRIPLTGALITADYTVGGGAVGNVAPNTLTVLSSGLAGISSVTNPSQAAGGNDAETLDHIRTHAPMSITAINRAVTLDDYAALTLNIPSISKAAAASASINSVTIYIHPAGGFILDVPTLQARVAGLTPTLTNTNLTGYLDNKKIATVSVQVLPPQYNTSYLTGGLTLTTGYVPVDVVITHLQVLPQYTQSDIVKNVITSVNNLILFDVVDFGYRVTLSSVYHAIMNVEGVDWVVVGTMCRHEASPPTLGDVVCASYEIPVVNSVTVNTTPPNGVFGGIIS